LFRSNDEALMDEIGGFGKISEKPSALN